MEHYSLELATLAGGCFWCLDAIFRQLKGVIKVESGYVGGDIDHPTYYQVCNGTTGHAEAVQITFDPQMISFRELLEIFFATHDPTTLNRQGADVGTQYRSAIFYHSLPQKEIAAEMITRLDSEAIWSNPIVTQLEPITTFYVGETYHQDYYQRNPTQAYCRGVIAPKLAKFRKQYLAKLSEG